MAGKQTVKKSTADCLAKVQEALDRIDVATTDIFRVIQGSDDDWSDGGWTRQNVNSALMTLLNGQEQMQEAIDRFSPTGKSTKKSNQKPTMKSKSESFNSMVKSIREKNNKKKVL